MPNVIKVGNGFLFLFLFFGGSVLGLLLYAFYHVTLAGLLLNLVRLAVQQASVILLPPLSAMLGF